MYKIIQGDSTYLSNRFMTELNHKILSVLNLDERKIDNIFSSVKKQADNSFLSAFSKRLTQAKEKKEKVFVFGDYDADGICATTLMCRMLDKLAIPHGFYIPNRLSEGYGITPNYVRLAYEKGYQMIITVDNGVSAFDAILEAEKYGMDFLIIDHHIIPDGNYIYPYLLHPSFFDDYFEMMCGAGTTLQLADYMHLSDDIDRILAMVATIGDMVPVFFKNREIIQTGLELLNKGRYKNISILSRKEVMDEDSISFDIVPKLNSYGRLSDRYNAYDLVKYLLLTEENAIIYNAAKIEEVNRLRKDMVSQMDQIQAEVYHLKNYDVYLSPKYHEGMIGLLANKLMYRDNKTVLVLSTANEVYKGSGRSIKGFDIFGSLSVYRNYFTAFGGHEQACGFSIEKDQLEALLKMLEKEEKIECKEDYDPALEVFAEEMTLDNIAGLDALRPLGQEFKLPYFYIRVLPFDTLTPLKNGYKKVSYSIGYQTVDVLCFKKELLSHMKENRWEDIIVSLQINEYRGRKTANLIINDIYEE